MDCPSLTPCAFVSTPAMDNDSCWKSPNELHAECTHFCCASLLCILHWDNFLSKMNRLFCCCCCCCGTIKSISFHPTCGMYSRYLHTFNKKWFKGNKSMLRSLYTIASNFWSWLTKVEPDVVNCYCNLGCGVWDAFLLIMVVKNGPLTYRDLLVSLPFSFDISHQKKPSARLDFPPLFDCFSHHSL